MLGAARRYLSEVLEELRKVSWPNRETTTRYTILVIVISLIVAFFLGGLDFIFARILQMLI